MCLPVDAKSLGAFEAPTSGFQATSVLPTASETPCIAQVILSSLPNNLWRAKNT